MGHALPTHFLASDLCPPPLPRRCRNKLFGGGGGGGGGEGHEPKTYVCWHTYHIISRDTVNGVYFGESNIGGGGGARAPRFLYL